MLPQTARTAHTLQPAGTSPRQGRGRPPLHQSPAALWPGSAARWSHAPGAAVVSRLLGQCRACAVLGELPWQAERCLAFEPLLARTARHGNIDSAPPQSASQQDSRRSRSKHVEWQPLTQSQLWLSQRCPVRLLCSPQQTPGNGARRDRWGGLRGQRRIRTQRGRGWPQPSEPPCTMDWIAGLTALEQSVSQAMHGRAGDARRGYQRLSGC